MSNFTTASYVVLLKIQSDGTRQFYIDQTVPSHGLNVRADLCDQFIQVGERAIAHYERSPHGWNWKVYRLPENERKPSPYAETKIADNSK